MPTTVRIHNLLGTIAYKLSAVGETRTAHTAANSNEGSSPINTQSSNKDVLSLSDLLSHTAPPSHRSSRLPLPAFPSLQLSVRELILNISDICTYYDSIPDPIIYSYRKSPFRSVIFQVALHRNEIKYDKHALLAFKAPVALKARTAEITTQHRERERERGR